MKKIFTCLLTLILTVSFSNFQSLKAVSANCYVLINAQTGNIIKESNCNVKKPMASTTKIMTALLLAEQNTPNKTVVVTKEMVTVEGSSMGLLPGDTVSYNDLLYGMLQASGNDAANVTAYCLGGSINGFAKIMNEKAQELGLKNTHFVTPSGLDDENHYTTAYDLALLAKYAMENDAFREAASTYKATLNYGNPPYRRSLTNHNKLLKTFDGAIGVKTGITKKSGRCLVSAAERNGKRVIAVTLKDSNDWQNHAELLEYGLNNLYSFTPTLDISTSVNVIGSNVDKINISNKIEPIYLTKSEINSFNYKCSINNFLYAPVKQGEKLGEIKYFIKEKNFSTVKIIAKTKAEVLKISFIDKFLKYFFLLLKI